MRWSKAAMMMAIIILTLFCFAFLAIWRDAHAELIKGTFLFGGITHYVNGYDFSEGRANYGPIPYDSLEVYDLLSNYIGDYHDSLPPPDGIGFYAPEGITNLGSLEIFSIKVAPEKGYKYEMAPCVGHTYCLITREKHYVKFHLCLDPEGESNEEYKLDYVLQLDGSRNLDDSTGVGRSSWGWIKSLFRRR